jgi:protein-S-isoprenylcysteine O-methyltransferase Ste14
MEKRSPETATNGAYPKSQTSRKNKNSNMANAPQSKVTVALVCFFLGWLGIHRMMMGYKNWWVMIIVGFFTCCIGSVIWALIDLIGILTGSLKMADGQNLQ